MSEKKNDAAQSSAEKVWPTPEQEAQAAKEWGRWADEMNQCRNDTLEQAAKYAETVGAYGTNLAAGIRALKSAPAAEDSAKGEGGDREPSPTTGMNIAQRILHVGGRNNAQGYVEFGSIQAVEALVKQVLRDLDWTRQDDDGAFQARYRIPGGEWSSWGHVTCGVKGHEQQLRYLPPDRQQRGGDALLRVFVQEIALGAYSEDELRDKARAALAAHKPDGGDAKDAGGGAA